MASCSTKNSSAGSNPAHPKSPAAKLAAAIVKVCQSTSRNRSSIASNNSDGSEESVETETTEGSDAVPPSQTDAFVAVPPVQEPPALYKFPENVFDAGILLENYDVSLVVGVPWEQSFLGSVVALPDVDTLIAQIANTPSKSYVACMGVKQITENVGVLVKSVAAWRDKTEFNDKALAEYHKGRKKILEHLQPLYQQRAHLLSQLEQVQKPIAEGEGLLNNRDRNSMIHSLENQDLNHRVAVGTLISNVMQTLLDRPNDAEHQHELPYVCFKTKQDMAKHLDILNIEKVRNLTTRQMACINNALITFGYQFSPAMNGLMIPLVNKHSLRDECERATCFCLGIEYQELTAKPAPKKNKNKTDVKKKGSTAKHKRKPAVITVKEHKFGSEALPKLFWDSLTYQQIADFHGDFNSFWSSLASEQQRMYQKGNAASTRSRIESPY